MRINKYIAASGVTSRRKADDLIRQGRVRVNGVLLQELGVQVGEGDQVEVDGQVIFPDQDRLVYLFNKPPQVLSSRKDPDNRPLVFDFLPKDSRLFLAGRLDYESEGLLVASNWGDLVQALAHPGGEVQKEYLAWLDRPLKEKDRARAAQGIAYQGVYYQPDGVEVLDQEEIEGYKVNLSKDQGKLVRVLLHEGKNREVRKIFQALGYRVVRLVRVRLGPLTLQGLEPGEYRKLTEEEVERLWRWLER